MKILILSASFPPYTSGVATFTNNLSQELSKKHSTLIISAAKTKRLVKKNINTNLDLYLLPGVNFKTRAQLTVPYPHPKKIETIINQFKPDVIHFQDFSPLSVSALAIANQLNIPTIITHHFTAEFIVKSIIPGNTISNKLSDSQLAKKVIYSLVNLIYNYCQLVTVPNPILIPQLKKAGLKSPAISIPNGIVLKNFQHKKKPSLIKKKYNLTGSKIILYVGRLNVDKNLDLLINAFKAVQPHNQDTNLVLVGTGHQEQKLKKLVKKLNLQSSVFFLGQLDNQSKDLSYLYNSADVFVNPSIIENHSISFIEAMAAGLPIIASHHPNLTSFIKPNLNGLLFKPNDPASLAVCLQKLLLDQNLKKSLSSNNQAAAQEYDIKNCQKNYLKAYQSLI